MSKYTKTESSPEFKLIRNLIIWLIFIPAGGIYVIRLLDGILYSYSSMFIEYAVDIIKIVLFLIIVPRMFRYIKALLKRKSLLKRIRRICAEKGYRFEKLSKLYLSIFVKTEKPEFLVITNKTIYSVNLFSAISKRKALNFCSETLVKVAQTTIKGIPLFYTAKKYGLGEPKLPDDLSEDLPVEKILLINPVPYKITKTSQRGTTLVDNHEKMFGYTLFAGTGFCNMLDRL